MTSFIFIFRKIFLISSLLVLFSSCRVAHLPGVQTDTWYISSEADVALKFDEEGNGAFLGTNRAVSYPQRLRAWRLGGTYRLRLPGRPDLRGRITSDEDFFQLSSRRGELSFRKHRPTELPHGPFRYKDDVFAGVNKNTSEYGTASGYYSSKVIEKRDNKSYWRVLFDVAESVVFNVRRGEISLDLDVYEPVGDTTTLRPLLVLLHGGAFIAGDKEDELVANLARDYARRGFVVVSVNYRLGYIFLPGRYSNLERTMFSAIQDVRAALRYMSYHRDFYRIDPHTVFLGGNSAGGILSLKTAFMDEANIWPSARGSSLRWQSDLGCLDCSSNELFGPFTIQGVMNMWGAIDDLALLHSDVKIPVLSIHGDDDRVVPFGHDYPFGNVSTRVASFFSRRFHGSGSIHEHALLTGLDHTLYIFEGLGHEPQFSEEWEFVEENYQIIHDQILDFMNKQLFRFPHEPKGPMVVGGDDPVAEYFLNWPKARDVWFHCQDCLILSDAYQRARIVWMGGDDTRELTVVALGPHQQLITRNYRIRITEE